MKTNEVTASCTNPYERKYFKKVHICTVGLFFFLLQMML